MGTIFHIVKTSLVWAAICTPKNTTFLGVCNLQRSAIGQMKANRSACYKVGAIFDSISSKPCEQKMHSSTLVMAEKCQKPLSYFFKWRKQCEDELDKQSTTTQVAHEDLIVVDEPTKKVAAKTKKKRSRLLFTSRKKW